MLQASNIKTKVLNIPTVCIIEITCNLSLCIPVGKIDYLKNILDTFLHFTLQIKVNKQSYKRLRQ